MGADRHASWRPCRAPGEAPSRLKPIWSGKRDLNPRPPAWKAGALPLSYSRSLIPRSGPVIASEPTGWWRGEDLNPRRRSPADLQSAPFGHLGTSPSVRPLAGCLLRIEPRIRAGPGPPGSQQVELAKGFEPPACCLQGSRSTPELRQQATKLHPMCQVPYCQLIFPRTRPRPARRPSPPAVGPHRRGEPPRPPPR